MPHHGSNALCHCRPHVLSNGSHLCRQQAIQTFLFAFLAYPNLNKHHSLGVNRTYRRPTKYRPTSIRGENYATEQKSRLQLFKIIYLSHIALPLYIHMICFTLRICHYINAFHDNPPPPSPNIQVLLVIKKEAICLQNHQLYIRWGSSHRWKSDFATCLSSTWPSSEAPYIPERPSQLYY
jgi:hypothetical protein